jgi:arylsulfatase A
MMTPLRKASCLLASIAFLAACSSSPGTAPREAAEPAPAPSIVIILADDLGWGDIGANGATLISTPNIDRIAQEGVRLTSFYAGSNVCSPSRAALLTGRYPIRSGMQHVIMPHSRNGLPQSEITLPELLRTAGYATGMVGKWHLGHFDEYWPTAHGFDEFFGVAYSNDMQPFDLYHHKTVVESPADQKNLTDAYMASARDFISRHAGSPFFLYYAETFPHIPLFVPDEVAGKSQAGLYGDVVEHLDRGVGGILSALDEMGIADNTIVILTSDNGPWFEGSAGDLRGRKGETYEGGFRVPFVARWPAFIPAGTVSDAMAMNIDLLPTLATLAGARPPTDRVIDGRDILPVLKGSGQTPHERLFFYNGNDIAAVRTPRFRLVLNTYYKSFDIAFERFGTSLLFDLERDPQESFSYVREYPEIVDELMAAVMKMRAETADLVKEPINPFPPRDGSVVIGPQLHQP